MRGGDEYWESKSVSTTYCNQRFGKDGPHCSKTIMRVKGQQIVQMCRQQSSMEPSSSSGWGSKLVTYAPLGLEDVLCLPMKKKVSHKDIIFERWGEQSILKYAYFTNTYNYRTQWLNNSVQLETDGLCWRFLWHSQGHTLQGEGHIGSKKTLEDVHAFDVAFLAILHFILPFAFAGIWSVCRTSVICFWPIYSAVLCVSCSETPNYLFVPFTCTSCS